MLQLLHRKDAGLLSRAPGALELDHNSTVVLTFSHPFRYRYVLLLSLSAHHDVAACEQRSVREGGGLAAVPNIAFLAAFSFRPETVRKPPGWLSFPAAPPKGLQRSLPSFGVGKDAADEQGRAVANHGGRDAGLGRHLGRADDSSAFVEGR